MPMNQAMKGREYREVRLTVDRDHVLRFADAIREGAPVFRDPEAARADGHQNQVAPPTFVTTLQIMVSGQAVADPELGLDYSRVVHGEQEFEWRRPVVVGDVLTAKPRISDIHAKGSHEYLVIEADIRDAAGETVVVGRSTLLSRGTART